MNNKEKIVKKLLFEIIDKLSKNADVYHYNGSLWLIHTEDRKWIVEFTKEGTLWYNYNFFRSAFKFVSLDVQDNKQYVSDWFELRFLNKPKVEDTIQNGVKDTSGSCLAASLAVEHTIQNGVKDTSFVNPYFNQNVEETIQNGVKYTEHIKHNLMYDVEDTIQNGVKDTKEHWGESKYQVEDTIQNGVKHTKLIRVRPVVQVEDTIQNGVKRTFLSLNYKCDGVEDTIQNGVKHTEKSLQIDGSCVIEDTIQSGVKEIKNDNNNPDSYHHIWTINGIIQEGVKEDIKK